MTLNQLFRIIENYAAGHSNINTIVFGAKWNIDNNDSHGILLWYDVQAGSFDGTQLNYAFELFFLDVLNPDNSNLKDVLSDTLQVAQDMAAMLYNYDCDVEFNLPKTATIQAVEHKLTSDYAGHSLAFTIQAPYEWNDCQVPVRDGYSFECAIPINNDCKVEIIDNNGDEVGNVNGGTILQVIAKDTSNVEIDCTYTLANGILTLSNIEMARIYNFSSVNTTLTNAAFSGKTTDELVVLGNGTELISINEIVSVVGTTITLATDLDGGMVKVIVF